MQYLNPKVIFAENQFGSYFIPEGTEHRQASACILKGEVWEADTLSFMREHLGKGDIIHAGTFFGDFLPGLSHGLGVENKIWAFEPNPENYFCATLTQKINHLSNVQLYNYGLGASTCKLPQKFFCSRKNLKAGGGSKIYAEIPKNKNASDFTQVSIIRGDDVIGDRYISIIHLDVEGFEQNALTGLLAVINQHRPLLILETIPSEAFMQQNLYPLGYRYSQKLDENSVFKI